MDLWEQALRIKLNREYEEHLATNNLNDSREVFVKWWNNKYPNIKMEV